MPLRKVICSLCQHEIPEEFLRAHRSQETNDIVAYTIELIKQGHPDWSENDPTCQKCWDEYRHSSAR